MPVNRALKNPLIKICGVVVIIYLGLFSNKSNPDSLGNRLSAENIQKNLHEAKKKSQFIAANISAAKKISKENPNNDTTSIKCGDTAIADYEIYETNKAIQKISNAKFTVGSKENWPIEKNIIGMKSGDIKDIDMLEPLKSSDQKTLPIPKLENNFKYHITIRQVIHNATNTKISCN